MRDQRTLGPNRRQKFGCSLEASDAPEALASSEISAPRGQQHRYSLIHKHDVLCQKERKKKAVDQDTLMYFCFGLLLALLFSSAFFLLLNAVTIFYFFCANFQMSLVEL